MVPARTACTKVASSGRSWRGLKDLEARPTCLTTSPGCTPKLTCCLQVQWKMLSNSQYQTQIQQLLSMKLEGEDPFILCLKQQIFQASPDFEKHKVPHKCLLFFKIMSIIFHYIMYFLSCHFTSLIGSMGCCFIIPFLYKP